MQERGARVESDDSGYLGFHAAGEAAKGEFHCAECGYGVIVHASLPRCPMCGGREWRQTSWHPLTRVRSAILR